MRQLEKLMERINARVDMTLREFEFDAKANIQGLLTPEQLIKFNAFYGITSRHPLRFTFKRSNVGGSYFLGKCKTDHSILYKSDIRGDELKQKGDVFDSHGLAIPIENDEIIRIKDSFLIKTLVHSNSHDPENPEQFLIRNTIALHYANIHGASLRGCFLGPFATADLCTLHSCIVGAFSYVQAGELFHQKIKPGTIWVKDDDFEFKYTFPQEALKAYIHDEPGKRPTGIIMDFVEGRKQDFEPVFDSASYEHPVEVPENSALNRYAVVKGDTRIGENVLISQRAYLEDAYMGKGANAQENSFIINSRLEGNDVTAHGGKIINAVLANKVFVGFNTFLRGDANDRLRIGEGSIIMPHTIIDLDGPMEIPAGSAVWGLIRNEEDLKNQSVPLEDLAAVDGEVTMGSMTFKGKGASLVRPFQGRIQHILEGNGALYDKNDPSTEGHAQESQTIGFNTVQPYLSGDFAGLYPTIDIQP